MWPDAEGDAAHDALEITLRRLRRLCGDKEAVARHGGRLSLDEGRLWTDVRAFHDVCGAIHDRGGGTADLGGLRARLLELYRGDLLDGEDEPWMLSARERLRSKLSRAVAALSAKLERAGDPGGARELGELFASVRLTPAGKD